METAELSMLYDTDINRTLDLGRCTTTKHNLTRQSTLNASIIS